MTTRRKEEPLDLTEAHFAAILNDAAKQYAEASGESLDNFTKPPMKNLDDLKTQLNLQNEQFSKFRAKRRVIFDTLSATFKPVEIVGAIVSEGASDVFAPAQGIYAAIAYLINAAHDVSAIYDSIVNLFEELQDFTSRLEIYLKHSMSPALREKLVAILASLFEVLVLATKEARRGRTKLYFKRLFGSDSPVPAALEKLNGLTQGEERQVIAETYGGVSQLNVKTDRVEDVVNQVHQEVVLLKAEARERAKDAHQDKLREILEPSPFPEDFFISFNKYRLEGSGEWLLEDEAWKAWKEGEMPYLWICGAPGTGKSFLTSRLISWGAEHLSHSAFFFFRDNNPETRSVLQALRDVAYQLSMVDAYYAKQLLKRLRSSEDIKTVDSAFRRLFVEPFANDAVEKTLYIFLDGIDEADPDEMKMFLKQLAVDDSPSERPRHVNLQIALTGRAHMTDTVAESLDPFGYGQVYTTLYVTPDRSFSDVRSFITQGVLRSRIISRTSMDFKFEIIETMVKQVDGLFILAKFMLAEVNRKRHPRSILDSLQSYPKEIDGMLLQSLKNISATVESEQAEDLNILLQWAACAEEVLSLEQLEAVFVLKIGDVPLQLEESLRGQYSCFFELEREDGLTTDDLLKEHERKQRRNDSPVRRSSPGHQTSPGRSMSPRGHMSTSPAKSEDAFDPKRSFSLGLSSSPRKQLVPGRHFSPSSTPDLLDLESGMEFRSNKSTTYVTFFHTSVKGFFSKENSTTRGSSPESVVIGFEPTAARFDIVNTCLSIFTDPEPFKKKIHIQPRSDCDTEEGRNAIKQYAAWYWQEHLAAVDPSAISADQKRELGQRVYQMLTDEKIIYNWSIMYERNNEGLEVLTDKNIEGLKRWMSDPGVLSCLEPEAREWVTKALSQNPGIFNPIGRFYAKAWLSKDYGKYVPTRFCFKIVQAIAFMEEGKSWSETNTHWSEIPVEKRIAKAAQWSNYEETAHWHRRVGSTFLTQGLHNKALSHYDQALKLEPDSVETNGRIAFCLACDGRFKEAREKALECEVIEEKLIASGKLDSSALASSQWRLYKDHMIVARGYTEEEQVENGLHYFRKAIKSASVAVLNLNEYFEAEIGYLELLANENRHAEMVKFLHEMESQPANAKNSKNRLVDLIISQSNQPLVMDWLPRAASKVGEAAFLVESLGFAIGAANTQRDHLKALYLRLSLGATLTFSRDIEGAIELFEEISFHDYRPRGTVPMRQGYALAFQKLAALYKEKALHAGLGTPESEEWIERLEEVQEKQSKHQNQDMPRNMVGSDVNVASIYLAMFYRLMERREEATKLLKALIKDSLDILSDDDQQNDEYGLENLLCLLIAADDIENAKALIHSMRKVNLIAVMTPTDSPVKLRLEPKLPDILSSNRSCGQCLEILDQSLDCSFCQYCLDSYCMKCMEDIIKKDGNHTTDRRADVICRSDHVWFIVPPLDRVLHRGEILLGDGTVSSFLEWRTALKNVWR